MLHLGAAHQPISAMLADQLQQVTLVFERQLASDMSAVNSLCMHVEQYRGKMLRPTLVLLSGLAAGSHLRGQVRGPCDATILTEKHRTIAAVVEMIHMATLVHDDVLDEAEVRRRGSTVNALWGNEAAVILGDSLISNAFHLCSTAGDPAINLALGQVTNTLCEGELVQLHHRNNYSIDEATYIEIVARKTASLIGECCRLGAMISAASERTAMTLRRFGELLGIAFQIQDDLLDLVGDQDVMGKSLGKDLDKGKLTLPVIIHLDRADQSERGEGLLIIEQRDARELRRRLIESGAVELTASKARQLVDEAKGELLKIDPGPARDLLADLAEAVISREF
jgi:octaprenyl-diphosphate synthase